MLLAIVSTLFLYPTELARANPENYCQGYGSGISEREEKEKELLEKYSEQHKKLPELQKAQQLREQSLNEFQRKRKTLCAKIEKSLKKQGDLIKSTATGTDRNNCKIFGTQLDQWRNVSTELTGLMQELESASRSLKSSDEEKSRLNEAVVRSVMKDHPEASDQLKRELNSVWESRGQKTIFRDLVQGPISTSENVQKTRDNVVNPKWNEAIGLKEKACK